MEVKRLHLEITTYCNASCPLCVHDSSGQTHPLIHLSLKNIEKILTNSVTSSTEHIQLCGSHGDPIMHKDIVDVINLIKFHKPKAEIEISTNGAMRNMSFWRTLANLLSPNDHVIFGIDGLSDTHHIYRVGTDFNKVIENAQTFIQAKGTAWWQFIPFKHNQHQIINAFKLSQKYQFAKFFVKYERAAYGGLLEKPTLDISSHRELLIDRPKDDIKPHFVNSGQFFNNCIHLTQQSIYVKADGSVTPCCFMSDFRNASIVYPEVSQETIDQNINRLMDSWNDYNSAFPECKKNCYSTHTSV